ncbi:lysM and putative peptidoglycan-binding domain-containing protein 3 [Rhinichthys klamathensis goyatoka]|uniref:lysM and putative peptidoglycan-binding domain-containing protein 3 n=1 Tax=Rhinichthys klamathensis goyatoka TaxID=3034132 RepID=UPI0024B4B051|nr:lysM and putative peptidoglycan-binding domain-containing protein 3 [Rhinichthys klamathensis goyatoka]
MTGRNQHNGFQFATTVQPPTSGYMSAFGNNSETEYSEEDGETFELRSRGRDRHRRHSSSTDRKDDIVYLIRDIKEGDTLISISLQYFCTVADIKRANNLLTEQDFFALRSIRIPVRKFSSFTETHATAPHKSSSPCSTRRITEIQISGAPLDSSSSSSSVDSVECFLQEKDKDIQLLVKSSAPSRNSLNEVVSSLEQPLLGDPERRPAHKKDPYYGADWGMRWWTAVAIMLVVGIITPVFYLLYYEVLMKADVSHHTTIDSIRPGPTQPAVAELLGLPRANAASHQDSHLQPAIEQQHFVKHKKET